MSEVRLCASDEVREFSTVSHRTHHLSASLLLQKSRAGHGHFRIQVDLIVRECWVLSFDVLRYTADCFWRNTPITIAGNRWRAVAKNRPCGMMINSPCALLKPPMVFRESGSRDEFSACHSAHSRDRQWEYWILQNAHCGQAASCKPRSCNDGQIKSNGGTAFLKRRWLRHARVAEICLLGKACAEP